MRDLIPRVTPFRILLLLMVLIAVTLLGYRYWYGLGMATNMSDALPWGWWKGFHMFCGIALAGGGFVLAGVVHILRLHRFEPFVRPAISTAFLGYVMAVIGLLMDLGRPWVIWHPIILWQPRSIMFELSWCVMLYTTVLSLEFLPVVFERFRWLRLMRLLQRVMIVLIFAGIILSTMHQSALGSLFVMMAHRLHVLWSSPLLPLFFLISAIACGISAVIFEGIVADIAFGHRYSAKLLGDLAKSLPPILGAYIGLKLMDLSSRGALGAIFENSLESWAFLIEIVGGCFIPGTLLLKDHIRNNRATLFCCVIPIMVGVAMNRLNVNLLGLLGTSEAGYLPSVIEIVVSIGVLSGGLLALGIINELFPMKREEKLHATPAMD
jgi:Ni/Fe-hydrogenase subunit HybB-like protein